MKHYCIRYMKPGADGDAISMFFVFAKTKQEAIRCFVNTGNTKKSIISVSAVKEGE